MVWGKPCGDGSTAGHIEFTALKFYVSDIRFFNGEKPVASHGGIYLADLETPGSLRIDCGQAIPPFDRVAFHLGIDSLTNTSGVMGGDLDPIKGMYWTWQSGYVYFKIEGTSGPGPDQNRPFTFHIGGYRHPSGALQEIRLDAHGGGDITVDIALDALPVLTDPGAVREIMSPGPKAREMAVWFASVFKTTP